ncbi:MAG: phage holin family protein [Clostridium sp.]|jgi:toxin secretion/phage lysis holin|nr:phage holin family protein [Clostridium sp.]DAY82987.1 MAG TPA: holin [Caudoviricetes sp.]
MDNMVDVLRIAAAGIGGIVTYIWGPWDALIIALVAMVVIDYITGVIKAAVQGKLSSLVGFKGLLKKVAIFLLVAVGVMVDRVIPATNEAVRSAVIFFYIANEGLSILENAGELGLPLPAALKKSLEKMQDKEEKPDIDSDTDIEQ